jgi:hypothetical protein
MDRRHGETAALSIPSGRGRLASLLGNFGAPGVDRMGDVICIFRAT